MILICLGSAFILSAFPAGGQGQARVQERARRLADMVAIALDEYALGVVDGRVVNQAEFEEAELFLREARALADELPPELAGSVLQALGELEAGVAARRPVGELRSLLSRWLEELAGAVGVRLDPIPRAVPSLKLAARSYARKCRGCHGTEGDGRGQLALGLKPPPADFTDRALSSTSPLDFFRKISTGVAGTEMRGFADALSEEERWALAVYASNFRFSDAERERGEKLLRERCRDCLLVLSDFSRTAVLSDDSLAAWLKGQLGDLPDSLLRAAVAYGRTAAAREYLGSDARVAARRVLDATRAGVAEALERVWGGDLASGRRGVLDAYLIFEGIEAGVRAREPAAAARVERSFGELRNALASERLDSTAVRQAAAEVEAALLEVEQLFSRGDSTALLFGQSLVIILREGLEAILIIGALVAFLARAGAVERKREIGYGALAAVAASLATAAAYATWFSRATASREVVEGVTMLIAAVVLFWVSYWLVSKIELRKWQAFVAARMGQALTSRRVFALAAVAFLAVYREGFETVLFYAALFASSEAGRSGTVAIFGGIAIGLSLLGAVYLAIQRYGARIPLKPFFATTSALLYLMAFSFVGQGIAELQEAGYLPATPLDWVPAVPLLGIFPTVQTVALQLGMLFLLAGSLGWVFWLQPKRERAS